MESLPRTCSEDRSAARPVEKKERIGSLEVREAIEDGSCVAEECTCTSGTPGAATVSRDEVKIYGDEGEKAVRGRV